VSLNFDEFIHFFKYKMNKAWELEQEEEPFFCKVDIYGEKLQSSSSSSSAARLNKWQQV
jgi:hypothetical protein